VVGEPRVRGGPGKIGCATDIIRLIHPRNFQESLGPERRTDQKWLPKTKRTAGKCGSGNSCKKEPVREENETEPSRCMKKTKVVIWCVKP